MVVMTEVNTEARRARRSWPARYKLDVLEEIDQAKLTGEPGAVGEIATPTSSEASTARCGTVPAPIPDR